MSAGFSAGSCGSSEDQAHRIITAFSESLLHEIRGSLGVILSELSVLEASVGAEKVQFAAKRGLELRELLRRVGAATTSGDRRCTVSASLRDIRAPWLGIEAGAVLPEREVNAGALSSLLGALSGLAADDRSGRFVVNVRGQGLDVSLPWAVVDADKRLLCEIFQRRSLFLALIDAALAALSWSAVVQADGDSSRVTISW